MNESTKKNRLYQLVLGMGKRKIRTQDKIDTLNRIITFLLFLPYYLLSWPMYVCIVAPITFLVWLDNWAKILLKNNNRGNNTTH